MNSLNETTQMTSFRLIVINLHFLFCLLISTAHFTLTCHGCHEQDRSALLDFKSSLEDPANRLASWQDSYQHQNCCNWLGVVCSYDSFRVISVSLRNTVYENYFRGYDGSFQYNPRNTSLTGNFPPSLFRIPHLEYIDLAFNDFKGTQIPLHLSNLTKLSHLDLSYSNIGSSISTQFNNLSSLHYLDLSGNFNLRPSSVKWVRGLVNLQVLHLSGIDLYTFSQEILGEHISHLSNLRDLGLSYCRISSATFPNFHNIKLLTNLDLSSNNFQGSIPKSISNLKLLTFLDLSRNNFQGPVSSSICELISLRTLHLGSNNITGSIPSCISNLHNLSVFDVSNNSIEGSVSLKSLINDLNLTTVDLSSNRLTVDIDQNISLYSKFKLQGLFLKSCNLKGLFPTFICKLSHFWNLDLSHNNLTGVIPSCISKLKNLASFDVSNNTLSGKISIEIGKRLSNYYSINLAGNQLSGSIPSSICSKSSRSSLQIVDLSNNRFSGVIPNTLGYCKDLQSLNLGSNNLTGNIPNEIEKLESLGYLQLQDNYLDGTLLNFISKLPLLRVLNLANNQFEGSIPTELFGAQHSLLSIISLRSNNFNGSISDEINNLNLLQILDLSHNKFSGHIPKQLGGYWMNLTGVSQSLPDVYDIQLQMVINGIMLQFEKIYSYTSGLDLSCNMLDGNIPTEIGRLSELARLNLSHNYFSGNIPASIGDMSNLASLYLSFNRLSGQIPQSLTSLDSLGVLNLSYNELSGQIPKGIHFSTLGGDGWAFVGNALLCGEPTKNVCEVEEDGKKDDQENYQEDTNEKLILYSIISLGFILGFWGLFFVMLIKKEKWWFPYWSFVDSTVAVIIRCIQSE
ncbi:receptor-like protein 12 [Papaver somniferum]|uniref:receptor-like protein 12 n=1 Tax=Papaver somniferum TaxID=3469 RepID=UPI000E705475|nr:receptor-like protein 12 [Papaver somniferum]